MRTRFAASGVAQPVRWMVRAQRHLSILVLWRDGFRCAPPALALVSPLTTGPRGKDPLILSIRPGCALPQRLLECPIATQWERPLSRSITIRFALKAGGHPEFLNIHKFRNFTEALSLELERFELGSLPMDEADGATTHVRITKIRTRNLRRCLTLIEGLLEQHFMKDTANIFVEDQA
jgi:hypothetical protein